MSPAVPPLSAADAALLAEAAQYLHSERANTASEKADLCETARTRGLDFATALCFQRLQQITVNASFRSHVAEIPENIRLPVPDLIAIAPGAFYREHQGTGADGSAILQIARDLGCPAALIPVPSFGRVDSNARHVRDWLLNRPERRIVLLSLSKGGADVKRCLAQPRSSEAFEKVAAWLSLSGIVQGTPLIAWLRARRLRWWGVHGLLWLRGQRGAALRDLRHGTDSLLNPWPALPDHLTVVHVCGVPLRHHLHHPWAARAYDRLAPLGPNDGGGILLADLLSLPGIVYPIWGADHYLQPCWDVTPLVRAIIAGAASFSARRQTILSATAPSAAPAARSTT